MTQTLDCPECRAQLVLPALPDGQSVQCPRCQHVFAPPRQRAEPRPLAATVPRLAASDRGEPDDELPLHEHGLAKPGPLRGVWTSWVVMTLLTISVLSFGVQAFFDYVQGTFEPQPAVALRPRGGAGPRVVQARLELEIRRRQWKTANKISSAVHVFVLLPTVIVFLIWFCQASRNLWTLQARGLSHSPASAVFLWFVPIMNLFRPYVIVQEIWRASHPAAVDTPLSWLDTPRSRLIQWWWCCLLCAIILPTLSIFDHGVNHDRPDDVFRLRALMAANVGLMFAGALLIVVIRKTSKRQQERYARLYDEAV